MEKIRNVVNVTAMTAFWVFIVLTSLNFYVANAADPPPLQQYCVGTSDYQTSAFINGKFCKNPNDVTINDFVYKGFNTQLNTSNDLASNALIINADRFPALNTLGISMGHIDFGPFGLNTPHIHPLASEMFLILEGTLYVGFITTDNKLFDGLAKTGDIIVFPQGLIHFQLNINNSNASALAAFGSQNPGRIDVPNALFGTKPSLLFSDVFTKAFQVSDNVIQKLKAQFSSDDDSSVETGRSILKLLSQAN